MPTKFSKPALLAIVAVTLSGCGHYAWQKPGGDPSTFGADNYNCQQNAIAAVPPAYPYPPPPYGYSPYGEPLYQVEETRCRDTHGSTYCKTQTSVQRRAPLPPPQDYNAPARQDLYTACMQAQGWVYRWIEDPQ